MTRLVRRPYGSGHTYTLDGRKADGVTTAISTGYPLPLKQWAADQAANYAVEHWDELGGEPITRRLDRIRYAHVDSLRSAALRGTDLHTYGERLSAGGPVEIPDLYLGPAQAYARFLDRWGIEPIATETPLANTVYGYGGTADLWATIGALDGEVALIDLKTGRAVYDSTALQLAAYRHADLWQPTKGEESEEVPEVAATYVAHVMSDDVELVPVETGAEVFQTFLYVLQTARWIKAHGFKSQRPAIGEALRPEAAAS